MQDTAATARGQTRVAQLVYLCARCVSLLLAALVRGRAQAAQSYGPHQTAKQDDGERDGVHLQLGHRAAVRAKLLLCWCQVRLLR
jgi:hypothetical protein